MCSFPFFPAVTAQNLFHRFDFPACHSFVCVRARECARACAKVALLSPLHSLLNPSIPAPIDQRWMSRRSVRPRVQWTLNCGEEIEEIVVSSHPEPSSRTRPPVNHRLTVRDSPWQRGCSIEKNGVGIHIGLFKSEGVLGLERFFALLDIYHCWLLAPAWTCTSLHWR